MQLQSTSVNKNPYIYTCLTYLVGLSSLTVCYFTGLYNYSELYLQFRFILISLMIIVKKR